MNGVPPHGVSVYEYYKIIGAKISPILSLSCIIHMKQLFPGPILSEIVYIKRSEHEYSS